MFGAYIPYWIPPIGQLPLPGLYVAISFGTDPVRALQSAAAQLAPKDRRLEPTLSLRDNQEAAGPNGRRVTVILAGLDKHNGGEPLVMSAQISTSLRFGSMGFLLLKQSVFRDVTDNAHGTFTNNLPSGGEVRSEPL